VVFFPTALLEQNPALRINQENGKGPVQEAGRVHREFFTATDGAILRVHEDELFGHGWVGRRGAGVRGTLREMAAEPSRLISAARDGLL